MIEKTLMTKMTVGNLMTKMTVKTLMTKMTKKTLIVEMINPIQMMIMEMTAIFK